MEHNSRLRNRDNIERLRRRGRIVLPEIGLILQHPNRGSAIVCRKIKNGVWFTRLMLFRNKWYPARNRGELDGIGLICLLDEPATVKTCIQIDKHLNDRVHAQVIPVPKKIRAEEALEQIA